MKKSREKRNVSLRMRMMLLFAGVAVLIIVLFYVMNGMFWNVVYMNANRKNMKTLYQAISEQVRAGNTTKEELGVQLEKVSTGAVVFFALQGDSDWEFNLITREMISHVQQEFLKERLQDNFLNADASGVKVLEKTDTYTMQRVTLDNKEQYMECFGYMEDQTGTLKKFIISLSLERINTMFRMSNNYFLLTGTGVFLLGLALIGVITERVTKPISRLTELSNRMKNLDFSARYDGENKDEIGTLGNNMNEMASQLERTIKKLSMANEELSKELEEKKHVDEMRKDFISNVSHELKTPIALIQGYAEGLQDLPDDPESRQYYIDVITDEASKMNRMVKKLMTLNQLEFGAADFTPSDFDMTDMVRSIVSASKKKIEECHASVAVNGPAHLMVHGDPFEIEEVVNNYYSNAFNHLREPFRIVFTLEDLGPTARISVKNTGEPIPEADLGKVWTKFYKVDKARTRSYGGSGIGLSIVKAIMETHGQEYGVYNDPDGVVFWFELARAKEEQENGGT